MNFHDIRVRPMEEKDIPDVWKIDKASAVLYWPENAYRFEVRENKASRSFVAELSEHTIAGFIVFWLILDELHIANFAVHPDFRRNKIGYALLWQGLQAGIDEGASVSFLEVRAGNVPATKLYEKAGFEMVGKRKGYYQDNHEDAILMNLDLKKFREINNRLSKGA